MVTNTSVSNQYEHAQRLQLWHRDAIVWTQALHLYLGQTPSHDIYKLWFTSWFSGNARCHHTTQMAVLVMWNWKACGGVTIWKGWPKWRISTIPRLVGIFFSAWHKHATISKICGKFRSPRGCFMFQNTTRTIVARYILTHKPAALMVWICTAELKWFLKWRKPLIFSEQLWCNGKCMYMYWIFSLCLQVGIWKFYPLDNNNFDISCNVITQIGKENIIKPDENVME